MKEYYGKLLAISFVVIVAFGVGLLRERDPADTNMENKQQAETSVKAEQAAYFNGVQGFYASPDQPGSYPGVIMVHEWWGLNDHIKEQAKLLAADGYHVLAVDLFGSVTTTPEGAMEQVSALDQAKALDNMKAAAGYLRQHGATKVASLGWCFGGGQSLQLALSGERLDATVIYYGNLVNDEQRLTQIKWPVLGIFGETDQAIPVEQVRQFDATLDKLGIQNEINIYPGVGHAFANPSQPTFAPSEREDAWNKTTAFLQSKLKP